MSKKTNLQDFVLTTLREERQVVTVFTTNGFQMKGRITAFDQFTVAVEIRGTQSLIYKSAISTIQPDRPIDLGSLGEEGA